MPNQPAPETELLRAAYAVFNARDIDAALALIRYAPAKSVGSGQLCPCPSRP